MAGHHVASEPDEFEMTGAPRWIQMIEKDFASITEAIGRGDIRDAAVGVAGLLGTVVGRPIVGEVAAAVVSTARKLLQIRPNQRFAATEIQSDAETMQQMELAKLLYITTMQALTIPERVQAQTFEELEATMIEALGPLVESDRVAGLSRNSSSSK